jgi:ADP-ribose pyrophosphatase YjhB (NUDIX family)
MVKNSIINPMKLRSSAAILVYNHELLLLLRDNVPDLVGANCWSLPGGIVEKGETYDEGLRRELKEEINLVPVAIIFWGKVKYQSGRISSYYFAKLSEDEIKSLKLGDEGQKMEFFDFENIKKLPLFGSIKKIIDKAPDILKNVLLEETLSDFKQIDLEKLLQK